MTDRKYNLRNAKGIMQYCKDELEAQRKKHDLADVSEGGFAMEDFGESLGAILCLSKLLKRLKESNPLVKLD